MPETAQEDIAQFLGNSEGLDGLAVLGQTAGRLKALLESCRHLRSGGCARHLNAGRPAEVLAHLADAETGRAAWRVRSVLAANGTPLQAFDQDAWASALKYGEVDPLPHLRTFTAARESLLSLLARVDKVTACVSWPARRAGRGDHHASRQAVRGPRHQSSEAD